MIGIIAAMEIEAEGIRSKMTGKKAETVGGISFVSGKVGDRDVVTAVCGMGKVFAAMCAQSMILRFKPDVIVNTGVAGTLTGRVHIGDVVISRDLVQHDLDTSPIGNPPGSLPELGLTYFPADARVISILEKALEGEGVHYIVDTIASGDQFLEDSARKKEIAEYFHAAACEMEGAAVAQVCYVNGVPFGVLRAISDEADGSAGADFASFTAKAAANTITALETFIKEW